MPARAPSGCTLAHGFQLGGDLLQGAVRRGGRDVGNQSNEPIVTDQPPRAVQQLRLYNTLGHQPLDGSAQPLDSPGRGSVAVEYAHDVAPRLVGAHAAHGR